MTQGHNEGQPQPENKLEKIEITKENIQKYIECSIKNIKTKNDLLTVLNNILKLQTVESQKWDLNKKINFSKIFLDRINLFSAFFNSQNENFELSFTSKHKKNSIYTDRYIKIYNRSHEVNSESSNSDLSGTIKISSSETQIVSLAYPFKYSINENL